MGPIILYIEVLDLRLVFYYVASPIFCFAVPKAHLRVSPFSSPVTVTKYAHGQAQSNHSVETGKNNGRLPYGFGRVKSQLIDD